MKRNFIYAVLTAFGVMFLGSCAQELDEVTPNTDADGLVTITASFPENIESKVAFSESSEGLDLTWENDDYLTVVSGNISEKYEIESIEGKVATFKGNPVSGTVFDVILSRSDNYASRTYTDQAQTTVASKDHLLYDAVLKGVSSYKDVKFTSQWAEANGGTFAQNGCLLIRFKMPEDAGYLKTVTLTAPEAVFYTTNSADGAKTANMTLALSDADMDADNVVEAYVMTSMQEASVSGELTLTVVSNLGTWSKKFTPGAFTLKTGMRNVISLNDKNWTVPTGNGTEANPYIIRTVEDLTGMTGKLAAEKKYFAMVKDIDMASVTSWIKIENGTPIDFNGNNRTISNFSTSTSGGFVNVLNGKIANLTMTGAQNTNASANGVGIVCGTCGVSGGSPSIIENVHVDGKIKSSKHGLGGIVGIIINGEISKCSADIVIEGTSSNKCGGIVGYQNDTNHSDVCTITNCYSKGSIKGGTSNQQQVGGIIGALHEGGNTNSTSTIQDCYSLASLEVQRCAGGIVGLVGNKGATTMNVIEGCIAWNSSIKTTKSRVDWYSSGAVAGCLKSNKCYVLQNCYRGGNDNLDCYLYDKQSIKLDISITPCDQTETYDSSNPLTIGTYAEDGSIYKSNGCTNFYPYHGKAAGAGETVSDVAKHLGWDETIWDLSGDYPQLIK